MYKNSSFFLKMMTSMARWMILLMNIFQATVIAVSLSTISLDQLANRYGYTKQYLSSLIKKISGQTFIELRTRKRMEQAKYLLASSDYSIAEICNLVGIRNLNSFYTKFKKQYHMMPNDYRKKSYLSDHFL